MPNNDIANYQKMLIIFDFLTFHHLLIHFRG